MKILVTGGAGFIGSNFIHYWRQQHSADEIVNLDLLTYAGNLENLQDLVNDQKYKFVHGDIGDATIVNKLVVDCQLIVNFAAESHVDRSIHDSTDFIKTNVEGTRVLLEAIRQNKGVRFHHISTDEVFGSLAANDLPWIENSPYDPRSPYSASKAAADHLVRAYYHTYGLPITISNCSNNYGPYQHPEKLIPLVISNLLLGKKIPLYGDGLNIRDWIHVNDHIRALDLIIHQGKVGVTYCLGGERETNNRDLILMILEIMNYDGSQIEHVQDRLGHDRRYAIDFSKIKRELGWEPQIKLKVGLEDTISWYQNHRLWWEKLK